MYPDWAQPSDSNNQYLPEMLKWGSDSYLRQTNWFLHHRDTGLRNLAAVLTGEFAVISLHAANAGVPDGPTVFILLFLGVLAVLLGFSASKSCGRSFRASLESVMLVTKTMWTMGLMDKVSLAENEFQGPPVPRDSTFYVPRFCCDARQPGIDTTGAFVDTHLNTWGTTYWWAKLTIWMFGVGAVVAGFAGAFMVLTT
jgi:hypothetical protein